MGLNVTCQMHQVFINVWCNGIIPSLDQGDSNGYNHVAGSVPSYSFECRLFMYECIILMMIIMCGFVSATHPYVR